jgi:hypothetical protein
MRKLFSSLLISALSATAFSQTSSINGTVIDSADKKSLVNTAITLLRKSDSTLVKFTRAGKEGNFQLTGLNPGSYILMNTHPYLGDYFDNVELKPGEVLELGKIYMTPKTKLLAEVILKSGAPIRIKGDTTIYTADSFKVRPGANVEELLRRLPGISVDKNGQITAMGERVKKVLVDGEEFFGSDPGIATKSLRADAVQEVQVFDKKSDQAEFTGIDDGVKDKTINLKMKKLSGYFGKIEAGGGLKDKFDNSVMINLFRNKRKLAGYGIMSNTGQTNLDWQDAQNYGGGMEGMQSGTSDDGGMWISYSNEDSYSGGRGGIPQNWNGGLHFSDKFNKQKNSFNSGYKFSKINAPGNTDVFSKTFLPDTSWSSNSRSSNFNSTIKHAFNLTMDFNLDSMNSLKWTSKINNNTGRSNNNYYSEIRDEQSRFINNSTRRSNNNTDKNNITSSLLWRHKYKKLSRTLSVNTDFNRSQSKSMGLLYSLNNYYVNAVLNERDTTDQQNINDNNNNSISTRVAYTEPLRKDVYLELSYGFSYNNSKSDRITNFKSFNGKYEEPVDSLSNSFVFNRTANTPGLNFRFNKKKYSFSFGTAVAFTHFEQKNITQKIITDYSFVNFLPRVSYNYKLKPNESIHIRYNGSNNAPSPEQLQPTRVNTDPLNVYTGNPDLKQSFRHTISTGYNFYNVLKERNLWSNLTINITDNAFVQSSSIDSVGKRTYQTVNADGGYNINLFTNYDMKIKDTKWRLSLGPQINIIRNIDFVNAVKNITNRNSYTINLNLGQQVPDKHDFNISQEFSWNHSKASVNKSANADYWSLNFYASASKNLPKNFEIGTDINTEFRQKDPRFPTNNNFTKWNAHILKRLMKDDKLELKLSVMDILNQNRGYDRNFDSYSFTETYYNTLRRYWLLSVIWNISKNGKPAKGFF